MSIHRLRGEIERLREEAEWRRWGRLQSVVEGWENGTLPWGEFPPHLGARDRAYLQQQIQDVNAMTDAELLRYLDEEGA